MKVSKGLEFAVAALPSAGHVPATGEDEQGAARVFYVAATRAIQWLVIGLGGAMNLGRNCSINSRLQQLRRHGTSHHYSVSSKHIFQ
jgi:superfamily I DNA/RNA helicase